jgi:hypothetical protein
MWWWLACLVSCGRSGFNSSLDALTSDGSVMPWQFIGANGLKSTAVPTFQLPLGTPTTAGELVVVAVQTEPIGTVTSVTDNASAAGTYTAIPSARSLVSAGTTGAIEIWYANTNAGATSVTAMASGPIIAVVAWQFITPSPVTVDAAAGSNDQPTSPAPNAPAITTARPGEVAIAVLQTIGTVSGVTSGSEFTNDELTYMNGWAHLTDPLAPAGVHVAQWHAGTAGVYSGSVVAFAMGP